jgi:hypothetical protein
MEKIMNLEEINNKIKAEKLNVSVVCFGGCSSNTLVSILEKNGYKVRSNTHDKILCHCPSPIKLDIPVIYVYRDPREALLSMKRRGKGIWDLNQKKLSNNNKTKLSDGNLLKLMLDQFYKWTTFKENKMLILKYDELFKESVVEKLQMFLNNYNLINLPIPYVKPHITEDTIENVDYKLKLLFDKYKNEINGINEFTC